MLTRSGRSQAPEIRLKRSIAHNTQCIRSAIRMYDTIPLAVVAPGGTVNSHIFSGASLTTRTVLLL